MKKINNSVWLVLALLSLLVGTWVLIAEGVVHSKFYVFYIFGVLTLFLLYRKRKANTKNAKPKKRR